MTLFSVKRILPAFLIVLIISGCNSSTAEIVEERCVKSPLVNNIDDSTKSDLKFGYFANKSFYLTGSDGKNNILLTNGIYLYWSPDGQKIAYRDGNEICVANSDGSHIQQITNDKLAKSDIVWSPSGKYLAFTVNHVDTQDLLGAYNNGEIYIATTEGDVTRLTNTPASSDNNPSWSPDEQLIVFESYSDPVDTGGYIVYTVSISVINIEDGKSIVVTKDGFDPIWFPDGKQLLFESIENQLCKVELEGQNRICITSGYYDYASQFSPDGQFIAFTRVDKDWSIYVMKSDGSEQTKLINGIYPIWSPDGNQIAFSTGGEKPDIYVINTDGTNLTLIAKNAWGYVWKP